MSCSGPGNAGGVNTRAQEIKASPETVWDVLADGWLYPLWVVGASRMRGVDPSWPAVGSRLHHSVGSWPVLIDDTTEVTACTPGSSLTLRARAWPTGVARVHLELRSSGAGTRLRMSEDAVAGPAVLVPGPARELGLRWRNREALHRLALLCEGRG